MPWGLSPAHLVIIVVILLIVVGPGKLPETGAAIGKTLRGFKEAMDTGETGKSPAGTQQQVQGQPPYAAQYPPQQPYPVQYPAQAQVQYPAQYAPQQPQAPAQYPAQDAAQQPAPTQPTPQQQ
jgi:sec-independent protein translocase protein TatA